MNIRQMVENRVWDEVKQEWVPTAPKTHAAAVETSDGSTVDVKLNALPGQITTAVETAVAEVQGGAPEDGNTLGKLYVTLETIKALLQADDPSLDTLQEIIEYVKKHGTELDKIGTDKVGYDDIVTALDTAGTVEGKVLDARAGKALKDLIDALTTDVSSLETQAADFVTTSQFNSGMTAATAAVRPVISENPPANPVDGQMWLKPAGSIEV